MKFTCTRKDIVEAIQVVSKGLAPAKSDQPMLSTIYLHAHDTILEVQTNNYEIGVVYYLPATVDEPGKIALSGKYFQEVIRKLPDDIVRISYDDESHLATIRSGAANFTLLSLDAELFPVVEELKDGELKCTLSSDVFNSLVKQTVSACSTSDSRPIFTGCNLQIDRTKLSMQATDTHQLALKNAEVEDAIDTQGETKSLIIPAKTLNGVMKDSTLGGLYTDIKIVSDYKQIGFEFDNIYIRSRLIEGNFPSLDNVIPEDFSTEVTVKIASLLNAVDRVSLISREDQLRIVNLDFKMGEVHISSDNKEVGSAEEIIPIKIDGSEIKIAFDSRFLLNALKALNGEFGRLSIAGDLRPMMLREKENEDFRYVITPVRTNEE